MSQIDGTLDCIVQAALGIRREAECIKKEGRIKEGIRIIRGQLTAINYILDGMMADIDKEECEQAFHGETVRDYYKRKGIEVLEIPPPPTPVSFKINSDSQESTTLELKGAGIHYINEGDTLYVKGQDIHVVGRIKVSDL